jgi:hypothetical protein
VEPGGFWAGLQQTFLQAVQAYYWWVIIILYPAWRVCRRAGFRPWASLLLLVPYVGLLALTVFLAFKEWPNEPGLRKRGLP